MVGGTETNCALTVGKEQTITVVKNVSVSAELLVDTKLRAAINILRRAINLKDVVFLETNT